MTNTPANGSGGIVYQITAVPEPPTWAILGLGPGLLAIVGARRRSRGDDRA